MFTHPDFDAHEMVTWIQDPHTGLRAVIAVHSTALGPGMGGCRLWTYPDAAAGLTDVLRLSRGMSLKNAMADLALGGGKAVIFGPVPEDAAARREAFRAFGRAVASLGGKYVTAEDVGVSVADMEAVAEETRHVSGLPPAGGAVGGDPSPYTARGVLRGIEAAVARRLGRADLDGLRVAVQGTGNVGGSLCRMLAERGADLVIAEANTARRDALAADLGAEVVEGDAILSAEADVFAPCALGGVLTAQNVAGLKAKIIAGAANNQLADEAAGHALAARGITYVPDYVLNAGGIIAVGAEYLGDKTRDQVMTAVDAIGPRVAELLARAEAEGQRTDLLADRMAMERIAAARG
ncbi:Glu/Leu/Phe/Val dehydrogenase dimerization domain-containing protein [Fluviibacterium sp. DFM31]|uniref:Glu/Leu/Phe/Val dehydrogenase dimerization domain-containing protein n=1 Tax=Meridianimarinicoccus marinus TaxID=3231483 RepID=A0ABV3L4U9_9RHOB